MLVKNNNDALAIIFPNSYDNLAPELTTLRSMASVPFASRYRLCDFMISSMVHSNISNISLMCRENYHSLMDHLGSGAEFDLARKKGGLNIIPPFAEKQVHVYSGRIQALASLKGYLNKCTEKYVIMADANWAFTFNFKELIKAHEASGADITMMYRKQPVPKAFFRPSNMGASCYTFDLKGDDVTKICVSPRVSGNVNFSMNTQIMERKKLIEMVEEAFVQGKTYFSRDVLSEGVKDGSIKIKAYEYTGYAVQIIDAKSYFKESMALLKEENCKALFGENTVYTKVRDDNPTFYLNGAKVRNIMAADGCVIEGTVENSIIFRGVKIGKGAKVKNCILMQDTVVEDGASIEYVVTDKDVTITKNKHLSGNDSYQVFVSKGQVV